MAYSLDDMVKMVDRLPTINSVASKIVNICTDPHTPISQLGKLISLDQSLYAQILKIANSSYFNFPRKILSVDKAIVLLGYNLLRDLTVSIAIYSFYKGLESNQIFNFQHLWKHAVTTGFIGQALAEKYDPENKELLYIAGLFHDLGKLVESRVIRKDFYLLVEQSQKENKSLHELEDKFLGFNHGDVGAMLLHKWNLPQILVEIVKHHHYPDKHVGNDQSYGLARLIYLSNLFAHFIQKNLNGFEDMHKLDSNFSKYCSFTESEFFENLGYIKHFLSKHKVLDEIFKL